MSANIDKPTVRGFGEEWSRFSQSSLSESDKTGIFQSYFSIFPWHLISAERSVGADLGCGSGRWASCVAPRVKKLYAVDPSAQALDVARQNLRSDSNVEFRNESIDEFSCPDGALDFAYSLGVLHHLPDTAAALKAIHRKLKVGAPLLVYIYYAFDNKPAWFSRVWQASDLGRRAISRLPPWWRNRAADALATAVYYPLATFSYWAEKLGMRVDHVPLSAYRDKSFYTMRTDALDRFGTRLEKRYTRAQIQALLEDTGFERVAFSSEVPFWCPVAYRR